MRLYPPKKSQKKSWLSDWPGKYEALSSNPNKKIKTFKKRNPQMKTAPWVSVTQTTEPKHFVWTPNVVKQNY
jgi:hypothetical protein